MRPRRAAFALLMAVALVPACGPAPAPAGLVEHARLVMGSEMRVAIWTTRPDTANRAVAAVFAEMDRLEAALSVWRTGSDVQRMNANAGRGAVTVGPDTRAVLRVAREAGRLTRGKFDITFGALTDIWKFDHDLDGTVPDEAAIAARLPFIGYDFVTVNDDDGTAAITKPGVRVHLGGIGKGYAVDRAVALLRAEGLTDFLIQAGGDLYGSGRRGTRPWRVGLHDPRGLEGESFASLDLHNETFSTSGDYERYFVKDGVRYHHLLDPQTGQPARLCRSVTILAQSAMEADWISTGVFILGPTEGMALVEQLPGIEAVIVSADNQVLVSSGLRNRLRLERTPTP